jgi:hypothetical protein
VLFEAALQDYEKQTGMTSKHPLAEQLKFLGENDIKAVLQRLDQLAQDEAQITAGQTLEVVYSLVQKTRMVMDGKQMHYAYLLPPGLRSPKLWTYPGSTRQLIGDSRRDLSPHFGRDQQSGPGIGPLHVSMRRCGF